MSKRTDFSVGTGLAPDRTFVVDNGIPFEWTHRIFFMKVPRAQKNWRSLLYAFDPTVWILVVITATSTALTFYICSYNLQSQINSGSNVQNPGSYRILTEAVTVVGGILLEQAISIRFIRDIRCKTLITKWLMGC